VISANIEDLRAWKRSHGGGFFGVRLQSGSFQKPLLPTLIQPIDFSALASSVSDFPERLVFGRRGNAQRHTYRLRICFPQNGVEKGLCYHLHPSVTPCGAQMRAARFGTILSLIFASRKSRYVPRRLIRSSQPYALTKAPRGRVPWVPRISISER